MSYTPNLNLPQQEEWVQSTVEDWAKAINDAAQSTNAFKLIDNFAGTVVNKPSASTPANYIPISDGQGGYTWAEYSGSGSVVILTLLNYNDSKENALATIQNPQSSDIAIIKAPITDAVGNSLFEYTAYIYSTIAGTSAWRAMDGNYSANNVYFNNNIRATTNVGYISSGTVQCKGQNVTWLMEKMLKHVSQPSATNPSASTSVSGGNGEVGTTFTPTWSAQFNPGSFTYGPATGCKSTTASVVLSNGTTKSESAEWTSDNGSFASGTYTDSYQSFTAQVTNYGWTASTGIAVDSIGDPASPPVTIAASEPTHSSSVATGTYYGWRKYFYGSLSSAPTYDSEHIRQLTNSTSAVSNTQFTLNVTDGSKFVVIAVLKSANKALDYVKDHSAFDTDIKDSFIKRDTAVQVTGANSYSPVDYDVYVYDTNGAPLGAASYYVKFKNK